MGFLRRGVYLVFATSLLAAAVSLAACEDTRAPSLNKSHGKEGPFIPPSVARQNPKVGYLLKALASGPRKIPRVLQAFIRDSQVLGARPEFGVKALSRNGRDLYIVPAMRGVCVALRSVPEHGTSLTCHGTAQWNAGAGLPGRIFDECHRTPVAGQLPLCERLTVFDVVPDDAVHAVIRTGQTVLGRTDVVNNVYLATVPIDPKRTVSVALLRAGRGRVERTIYTAASGMQ
jgi:hypothetical protein